jgi:hypothetical protein
VSVPAPAEVKVIVRVPCPAVIVPPVTVQAKVAPGQGSVTDAPALAPENIEEAVEIVASGLGLMEIVACADSRLVHPFDVTMTLYEPSVVTRMF